MGRGTGKLTRSVLKRTEELRGHPPVDMEGALSASAHSEVVAPRAGRGGTTSSNPLCSSSESANFQYLSVGVISQRGRHDGSRRRCLQCIGKYPNLFLVIFFAPFVVCLFTRRVDIR